VVGGVWACKPDTAGGAVSMDGLAKIGMEAVLQFASKQYNVWRPGHTSERRYSSVCSDSHNESTGMHMRLPQGAKPSTDHASTSHNLAHTSHALSRTLCHCRGSPLPEGVAVPVQTPHLLLLLLVCQPRQACGSRWHWQELAVLVPVIC
jgi:hypothetical protein